MDPPDTGAANDDISIGSGVSARVGVRGRGGVGLARLIGLEPPLLRFLVGLERFFTSMISRARTLG
jgi:hypothetical protein